MTDWFLDKIKYNGYEYSELSIRKEPEQKIAQALSLLCDMESYFSIIYGQVKRMFNRHPSLIPC